MQPTPKAKPTKELEAKAAEAAAAEAHLKTLSDDFVALHLEGFGNVTLGFYPNAAPRTVARLLKLFRLGCYNTNQVFRVDKGFVAQVQGVAIGDFSSAAPLPACHPLHHDLTLRSSHHGRCKVWMAVGELQ